jgi:hypothetical protein
LNSVDIMARKTEIPFLDLSDAYASLIAAAQDRRDSIP